MRPAERLLVALASGAAIAVLGYAVLRGFERAFFMEVNPAALIWSDRSGFAWRALLGLYAGSLGGFGGYALAVRAPRTAARALSRLIAGAAITLVLQAAFLP